MSCRRKKWNTSNHHQRKESKITNLRQITLSGTLEEGLSLLKLRLVKGRSTLDNLCNFNHFIAMIWYLVWRGGFLKHSDQLGDRFRVHDCQSKCHL